MIILISTIGSLASISCKKECLFSEKYGTFFSHISFIQQFFRSWYGRYFRI